MSRESSREARRPFWQMSISQIGRRRASGDDEVIPRVAFQPTLPQVDLLPGSVRDAIATAHIRRIFVWILVVLAAGAAAIWLLQADRISRAESAVAAATATNEQVRADLEALGPVRRMYEQITRLKEVVQETLASQPQAAPVIDRILAAGQQAAGADASFVSIDVVYQGIPGPGDPTNPCPNPDPFRPQVTIGCVTFDATMSSRAQVSELLRILESDPLFVGPYVTTSTASTIEGEGGTVSFTGSAGISPDGLVTPLTAEQIAEILVPPQEPDAEQGDTTPMEGATTPTPAEAESAAGANP